MADATGTEPEEWALWRAFLKAQARLDRRIDGQLQREAGMTQGEYGAIAAILESPGRQLRVGEVARELGWERSRVSHLVARLERKGWLSREQWDQDRRAAQVTVTPGGRRAYLAAVRGHAAEVRAAFFVNVEPDERDALAGLLRRIIASSD